MGVWRGEASWAAVDGACLMPAPFVLVRGWGVCTGVRILACIC